MVIRQSEASWEGDLRSGHGSIKTGRSGQEQGFSFASRLESGEGTSPEELVAAAHAGCYAMALSNELASSGHTPERVDASAVVQFGPDPAGGFHIPRIDLTVRARVPGLDAETFQEFAEGARVGCPISKLYAGTTIGLDAELTD